MDESGPTLLRRALAVLQAKQYLVFYAIPVYALVALVPLVLSWLHEGGSAEETVASTKAPLYDAAAAPGFVAIGILVLYLAVFTWFRAGLIRSIVGRLHLRPQDGAQFASLLGLQVIIEALSAAGAWVILSSEDDTVSSLVGMAVFAVGIAIMYADYAIVITGLDPVRAIARSWACVRANLVLSLLVALVVNMFGIAIATMLAQLVTDGITQAVPLLVIDVVVMGVVTFVADVVLVVAYVHAVETGRLPRAR